MRRLIILVVLAVILAANASSQFHFGLRGGINTAYFKAKDVITDENVRIATLNDATVGFHGGVMAQVSFFGMFFQPELLLSSIGSEVRVNDPEQNIVDQIKDQSYTKLDFPLMVGKRFGPLRAGIGPVGTIMLNTDSELNELGYREKFRSATFGYQLGAGLDIFKRFALDLKYEGNLSRLGSGITIRGQEREFDTRSRQFIVSLGVFF
jgi:opacity protein-like surface antigen